MLPIQLRWIAVIGQVATIVVVQYAFGIALPLAPMLVVIGALVALNLASLLWLKNRIDVSSRGLLMVLMLDVAALTAQLYLSGGAANPFTFLYLLQITIAAVLLDAGSVWAVVALAFAEFGGLRSSTARSRCRIVSQESFSRCASPACSSASCSMRPCSSSL